MSVGKGSTLPSSIGCLYSYIKNVVQGDAGKSSSSSGNNCALCICFASTRTHSFPVEIINFAPVLRNERVFCVAEVDLNKLDEELIRLLAWQRIQQLLSPKSLQPSSKCGISPGVAASLPKPSPHTEGNKTRSSHHVEAVLMTLPVLMWQIIPLLQYKKGKCKLEQYCVL